MPDVFVIVPVRVHREALAARLGEIEGFDVVGAAATLGDALPRLRALRPDAAVLDAAACAITDVPPQEVDAAHKLVALGVREDEAVAWIERGVFGYVLPDAPFEELVQAVGRVARGELDMSPLATAELLTRVRRASAVLPSAAGPAQLSPREREVLALIEEGLPNKLIARRLSIQEQTVKNHVHNILVKLGVHRRTEAVARMRAGA